MLVGSWTSLSAWQLPWHNLHLIIVICSPLPSSLVHRWFPELWCEQQIGYLQYSESELWRQVYLNCWTILEQTLVDYLGGDCNFLLWLVFFPHTEFFSPQKRTFFCVWVFTPAWVQWYCAINKEMESFRFIPCQAMIALFYLMIRAKYYYN